MKIAVLDIGGTGIKFASMTPDGEILKQDQLATPDCLETLLNWIQEKLEEDTYAGLAMSVPGAVDPETGVIAGFSAVPYIHGFSWKDRMASYQIPVHLENDANCVGLSELLAHPEVDNLACVVVGTGIGGAMILNGKLHRGKHSLGGEYGYMILKEPGQELGNWSQLASTGRLVRRVREETGDPSWDGRKIYQAAKEGNEICRMAIEETNQALAQGLLNIQYLFDPDQISLGGSISRNPDFLVSVQEAVAAYVERYEEYTITPEIVACHYQGEANLYGALVNWLQEEGQWQKSLV